MARRRVFVILNACIILILTSFCEKDPAIYMTEPVVSGYERMIRNKFDDLATFKWSDYATLLEKLMSPGYLVLPLDEMRKTFDTTRVVIGLRHDVDLNPFKAVEMARIEDLYGIRSTYFFLATAEYYGKIENSVLVREPGIQSLIREVHKTGSEIGIHNDLLTVMIKYKADPLVFCREEIRYYRSLGIRIHGTAAHGSDIAKKSLPNYDIFSDYAPVPSLAFEGVSYPIGVHSLKEFGFEYEAYKIPYNKYFSDSGGHWNDPEGIKGVIKQIEASRPGDRIEILVHPDWWGKQ